MRKYLRETNGEWHFVEEQSMFELLSSNAGSTIEVRDLSDEETPRFSLFGKFANPGRYHGDKIVAFNEYNTLYAELSIASEDKSIWESRLWVLKEQNNDVQLSNLAIEIMKLEKPDSILYFSVSKTPSIIAEINQEANVVALNRKYSEVVPAKFQNKLRVTGLCRTRTSQDKNPVIILEADALKVDISVRVDFFSDLVETTYHYNNALPRREHYKAYEIFPYLKAELVGKYEHSNTILSSMRIHSFLETEKEWNTPEFVEKILEKIDPLFLQNLK